LRQNRRANPVRPKNRKSRI